MPHKPPFNREIADEWLELIGDKGERLSFDERERRWKALYEKCYQSDAWIVGTWDAGLVSGLGWNLAIEAKRYAEAKALAERFLQHRDAETEDVDDLVHFLICKDIAGILAGEVTQSASRLAGWLTDDKLARGQYKYVLTHKVLHMLDMLGLENAPQPEIRTLASDLLLQFSGMNQASNSALTADTNAELSQLLGSIYSDR